MNEKQRQTIEEAAYAVRETVGRSGEIPAYSLQRAIESMGYRLRKTLRVPTDMLSYVDFDRQTVYVASDLPRRLEFPASAQSVYFASLAHELGHIVLHEEAAKTTLRSKRWEEEAIFFAQVFLVPYHDLVSLSPMQEMMAGSLTWQNSLWRAVLACADHFKVSGAFLINVLREYDLIEFDFKTREITPRLFRGRRLLPLRVA